LLFPDEFVFWVLFYQAMKTVSSKK